MSDTVNDDSRIVAADAYGIGRAVELLRAGRAIAFPTETVYGLGADADSAEAVAEVFRIKGRPTDHPLIVHVSDIEAAGYWAEFDDRARRLATVFWPGPLTLILTRRAQAPAHACGSQQTVGLRCPSDPVARRLLRAFTAGGGHGIAAPSANRFGRVSPTRAQHVLADLDGDVELILDGGEAPIGLESTILDLSGEQVRLLRPGAVVASRIEHLLDCQLALADPQAPKVSGMLAAHYAPRTPIELLAAEDLAARVQALRAQADTMAVWSRERPDRLDTGWFRMPDDPEALAHQLYDTLRRIDQTDARHLLIEVLPGTEPWQAATDRLARAALGSRR